MAINVRLRDIANPQHLAALVTRANGNPDADADRRVMIVHTGWIGATHGAGADLTRQEVVSFVPLADGSLQEFGRGNVDLGEVQAVVAASLSSFGGEPDTAAVDRASVRLEPRSFKEHEGRPLVLVLRAQVAAAGGAVHGIAYQVTVLAHPSLLLHRLEDLPDDVSP